MWLKIILYKYLTSYTILCIYIYMHLFVWIINITYVSFNIFGGVRKIAKSGW